MSDELTGKFGLPAEISPDKYRYTVFGNSGGLFEGGAIEIAPLAYMRGRTLSNAFIILEFGGILHYVQKDVKKYVILSVSEISHCIKCSVLIQWDSSFHSE